MEFSQTSVPEYGSSYTKLSRLRDTWKELSHFLQWTSLWADFFFFKKIYSSFLVNINLKYTETCCIKLLKRKENK